MSDPTANIPKAVLYVDKSHAWSSAARICLVEKGYGSDEIDIRLVDLSKGENYAPTFLRLNSLGTLPTLVVPYENTLTSDVDARYKAVTDVESIVVTLDRSRSATSRTRTTSSAPAPSLSPATVAFSTLAHTIISLLQSSPASPELLFYMNARNDAELKQTAGIVRPFLEGRKAALGTFLATDSGEVRVSQKTRTFWEDKKDAAECLLAVITAADKAESDLDDAGKKARADYFENTKAAWEVGLSLVLTKLSTEITGPFALGDQFSIADVHLAAWLGYVVRLAGGSSNDSGADALAKLESRVGGGFTLPRIATTGPSGQAPVAGSELATPKASDNGAAGKPATTTKLEVFWNHARERESWKAV